MTGFKILSVILDIFGTQHLLKQTWNINRLISLSLSLSASVSICDMSTGYRNCWTDKVRKKITVKYYHDLFLWSLFMNEFHLKWQQICHIQYTHKQQMLFLKFKGIFQVIFNLNIYAPQVCAFQMNKCQHRQLPQCISINLKCYY